MKNATHVAFFVFPNPRHRPPPSHYVFHLSSTKKVSFSKVGFLLLNASSSHHHPQPR